jgi:hypothetical protein
MTTCLNCQNTFEGKYCNECGQKASTRRVTVRNVLHDLPHALFHVDKGILKNVSTLRDPRKAVQEYLQGKRVGYFNPVFFFLLSTGLILFIEHLMHKSIHFDLVVNLGKEDFDAGEFLSHYLKYIYFASGFVLALPALLLFRRETHYNYAEQVLASVFILGYTHTVYLAFIFFPYAATFPLNPFVLISLYVFTVIVYYRGKLWLTMLKALIAISLQFLLFLLFILVSAVLYALVLLLIP